MSEAISGQRYSSLVIRDAMLINGRGTPAFGPVDLVVERDTIADVVHVDPVSLNRYPPGWERPEGDHVIDAEGMYVIPGMVDMHAHVPFNEATCGPRPSEYAYKLWLAHGVTTLRTCGFGTDEKLLDHRRLSEENELVAPRLVVLGSWPPEVSTPEEAREQVHRFKELGVDGIKIIPRPNVGPEVLYAMGEEVREVGLRAGIAIHIPQNSEIDAVDASWAGGDMITIEHTYGIPQAALPGTQSFPPDYNYADEVDRFRWSGHIWAEADLYPEEVLGVLETMIENGTAWDPTMVVYEINRELEFTKNREWHERYTVPQLLDHWKPSPAHHASFHFDWKTSDEVAWKEKYRIWMSYLKEFFDRGGTITAGTDAGFMYALYGFSNIRELELLQEAGIHPIDVIKIATTNAATVLGLEKLAGGVRKGCAADLAIVDGNPLDNFKVIYGTGVPRYSEDRTEVVRGGGVRWTIKDGVVFDAKALLRDVEDYVKEMKG
jgi:cytosine/adenosine deaminase-related metal-dependent hydrolase